MAKIDLTTFNTLVAEGYLTCRAHPGGKLVIWNYTPKTQFDRHWTDETRMARGLITKQDGTIVARPFPKFFNLGESDAPEIPMHVPIEVTEKMDGSLGILYYTPSGWPCLATRGSFVSDQAVEGTLILCEKYKGFKFDPDYTYLFEIVFPANKIVVDYGNMRDLVLLAVIETETGQECDIYNTTPCLRWPFPVAKRHEIHNIAELLSANQEPNHEGFVVRLVNTSTRIKYKFEDYVRLHRIMTGVTARTIWEVLSGDDPVNRLQALIRDVPDEFFQWVQKTQNDLQTQYWQIEQQAHSFVQAARFLPTRKEQAALLAFCPYKSTCFAMLDRKPHQQSIWKLLRPAAEKPFSNNPAQEEVA